MNCAICFQQADKLCSGCKKVNYCSVEHQKEDWKKHKHLCAPFSVSTKDGVKLLILRKDVPKGTILLEETPLFHIPESNGIIVDSICLVCGVHMSPVIAKKCSVCNWPVCGFECESHPIHRENECRVLTSCKFKYEPRMLDELPSIITQIRAMCIKTMSPNTWFDLTTLLLATTPFDDEWKATNGGKYKKFIKKLLPNSSQKERQEAIEEGLTLRKVLMSRAFYFNAQDTLDTSETSVYGKWRAGFYVYKKASLATHSCAPNCIWNISNFPDFKIRLRAAYPLVKGQVLSVSHLEHHAEGRKGTIERRIGYYSRFGHICMCDLCIDPTEFGTYMSAIVCTDCRGSNSEKKVESENLGYFLPDSVIVGSVPWRCNACEKVVQLSEFYPLIDRIAAVLEENDGKAAEHIPMTAVSVSKSLIAQYRDTFLHPNHWLLHKATFILIEDGYRRIKSRSSDIDNDVKELSDHCQYMLKILNQLYPGYSTRKIKTMIYQTTAITAQMERNLAKTKEDGDTEIGDKMLDFTTEIYELKKNILEYYKDDFPVERGRDKSEMAEQFENDLNGMTTVQSIVEAIQGL